MSKPAVSGNILFLILIAVALFAALSYAITGSSRSGVDTISKDKAKILASRMIQFGANVEQSVNRLQLSGIPLYAIDFSHPSINAGNAANSNCSDDSCKLFHASGGGAVPITDWPAEAMDAGNPGFFSIRFGALNFEEHGSSLPEIVMTVMGISDEVCNEINQSLNGKPAILDNFGGGMSYIQNTISELPVSATGTVGDTGSEQNAGKYSLCAFHAANNYYIHVLKVR